MVLKAGSNPPSNQMVTLDGGFITVQPTLGSERTGKAWLQALVGCAVTMANRAMITIKRTIALYFCVGPMVPQGVQVKMLGQMSSMNTCTSPLTPAFLPEN